jgi:site-specific DNA-methyltransferase (adenine-specific)
MSEVLQGDCLVKLKEIADNSVDAIITDPPYELGFMGKKWDNSGIAYNVEMWKECLRVLKPGGYLLSFGGTRTYHRMACAIEDAGFEIKNMLEWIFASGFPKSQNIGKMYDKKMGNERVSLGKQKLGGTAVTLKGSANRKDWYDQGKGGTYTPEIEITKGTSPYEGLGTALKPSHEPICMARKPLSEKTVVDNVMKWGTGGIEIDECRIPTSNNEPDKRVGTNFVSNGGDASNNKNDNQVPNKYYVQMYKDNGRFPANVLCQDDALNDGEMTKGNGHWSKTKTIGFGKFGNGKSEYFGVGIKDNTVGSKSRYFDIDIWNEKYGLLQFPKASKSEKNKGCKDLEKGCFHPTVKPLALMRYLVTLVSRKGQTVLDPFAGSGTTLVACKELGRNYIGIELEEEYVPIIEARLKATKELEQFKQANLFEKTRKEL